MSKSFAGFAKRLPFLVRPGSVDSVLQMKNHALSGSLTDDSAQILRRIRIVLGLFMAALVASGVTAFPLLYELNWTVSALGLDGASAGGFAGWVCEVQRGLTAMYAAQPWIAYGTDWLAFAHIVIAVFFIGAWVDPARNIWVLKAGIIACALVPALALIAGPVRGIPLGWRLIDSSFGVLGALPLFYCLKLAKALEINKGGNLT